MAKSFVYEGDLTIESEAFGIARQVVSIDRVSLADLLYNDLTGKDLNDVKEVREQYGRVRITVRRLRESGNG